MTVPRPIFRLAWAMHRGIRRISGGRLGTRSARDDRLGTLFLHTVGRKSGRPRVNGLFYLLDGRDVIVVGSNAGAGTDPAWWLNLREQPEAEVEVLGQRRPVRARSATTDEAVRLWPRLDVANPEFAAYRANAGRPIPLVLLEPR